MHLFPIYWILHSFQTAELKAYLSSSRYCNAPDKNSISPFVKGLRNFWISSKELKNYPSKGQYITFLEDSNNNIVHYCWSFAKSEVKDDCFFGTSFWDTLILFDIKPWNDFLQLKKSCMWFLPQYPICPEDVTFEMQGVEASLPKSCFYNWNSKHRVSPCLEERLENWVLEALLTEYCNMPLIDTMSPFLIWIWKQSTSLQNQWEWG